MHLDVWHVTTKLACDLLYGTTPNDVELEHEIGNEFDAVATKLGVVQSGLQVCSKKNNRICLQIF